MLSLRLPFFVTLFASLAVFARAEEGIDRFTGPEANAEAARLYERADQYTKNVTEGLYSYAYIQFYWKRAGANIDRIAHAYPESPTAKKLAAGELKVGPFEPVYYKERVLPRLEEKKVASFDAINCAIFLYNLETNTAEAQKRELLATIIKTLCRQIRWSEALAFPVLDEDRPWLWEQVVRQSSIYHNDELTTELLTNILPDAKPRLLATVAEGLAFRGEESEALEKFLTENGNAPELRTAAFSGLVRRELQIERATQQNRPLKGLYDDLDGIQKSEQRVDLAAFLATIPADSRAAAQQIYARYLAGIGRWSDAQSIAKSPAVTSAWLEYLVLNGRFDEAIAVAVKLAGDATTLRPVGTLLITLEHAGRADAARQLRADLERKLGKLSAAAVEFRARMFFTEDQLVVREHTFANTGIADPNALGRLICEWSLTPNRTLRGAAPWDAVVFKFAPGFENLPPPKDKNKVEAAGR